METVAHTQFYKHAHQGRTFLRNPSLLELSLFLLICPNRRGATIHLYLHNFTACILVPFVEYIIRYFVT